MIMNPKVRKTFDKIVKVVEKDLKPFVAQSRKIPTFSTSFLFDSKKTYWSIERMTSFCKKHGLKFKRKDLLPEDQKQYLKKTIVIDKEAALFLKNNASVVCQINGIEGEVRDDFMKEFLKLKNLIKNNRISCLEVWFVSGMTYED